MLSLAPMEEISRESGSPFWFHVQQMKDRGLLRSLLVRALALQSPVLIFTFDWTIPSQNPRNIRHRLGQHTARGLVPVLSRPRSALSMTNSGRTFAPGHFATRLHCMTL